jgi:hypothetical protein
MSSINTFRASGEAKPANSADQTVLNGVPYDAHEAIRSGVETAGISVDAPGARIAEEIKRRQISLALRYVAAVRAR